MREKVCWCWRSSCVIPAGVSPPSPANGIPGWTCHYLHMYIKAEQETPLTVVCVSGCAIDVSYVRDLQSAWTNITFAPVHEQDRFLCCPLENNYSILMMCLYSIVHDRPHVCCFSRSLHPFSLALSSRTFNDREAGRQHDTGCCDLGYLET